MIVIFLITSTLFRLDVFQESETLCNIDCVLDFFRKHEVKAITTKLLAKNVIKPNINISTLKCDTSYKGLN